MIVVLIGALVLCLIKALSLKAREAERARQADMTPAQRMAAQRIERVRRQSGRY